MKTLGAKQFREPLLRALGRLTAFQADKLVEHRSVYPVVCQDLGIDLKQFGLQKGTDIPWVELWVQWAFKYLTETIPPSTVSLGKGKWALTETGVQEAHSLLTVGSVTIVNPDDPDPYLQSLQAQQTPCFDFYSEHSPVCSECPLQVSCQSAKLTALSEIARKLRLQTASTSSLLPKKDWDPEDLASSVSRSGGKIISLIYGVPCKRCHNLLDVGSKVVWFNSEKAMYHPECYLGGETCPEQ